MRGTLLALSLLLSCGSPPNDEKEVSAPPSKAFVEVKPIIEKNCGGCHNGNVHPLKFNTESAFKNAKVRARIENGSMPPPPRQMSGEDKARLIAFLK